MDWDKVAKSANYSSGKYARDQFAVIRKKLLAASGDADNETANGDGEGAATSGKGKKKATPRKRKGGSGMLCLYLLCWLHYLRVTDGDDEETPKTKKTKKAATPKTGEEDAVVKDEPNEAGELMDQLN